MRALLFLTALLLVSPGWAAEPPKPPKTVPLVVTGDIIQVIKSFPAQVTAAPGADFYVWSFPDGVKAVSTDNVLTITSATNGAYRISVVSLTINVDFEKKIVTKTKDAGSVDIQVGLPAPPDPPTPPTPPTPPVPVGVLRALIVYESADLPKLPDAQRAIILNVKARNVLKDKCDKAGPDGRGYNIWDKDLDASGANKFWQDVLKRPRASTPFVHLYKGDKIAFEGPLPADEAAFTELINKYAS